MTAQTLDSASVKRRIDEVLGQVPKLLAADPSGIDAQRFLARRENQIANVVAAYFDGVPGPPYDPPLERQQRVSEVENYIAAHEGALIDLLRASSTQTTAPDQLRYVLPYAKPTDQLKRALLDVTHSPDLIGSAVEDAYGIIFQLKLDDEQVHRDVLAAIDMRNQLHSKAALGGELLGRAATQWALSELEPLYRQFLSIPYKLENYPARGGKAKLQSGYNIAALGLAAFGTRGADFADLLKARLAEMDPAEDVDLVNAFKETLAIVEGMVNPKPIINKKGQLLGISQVAWPEWKQNHPGSASAKSSTSLFDVSNDGTRSTDNKPKKPSSSIATEGESPSWLVWLVVVIVATAGAVWLFLRGKGGKGGQCAKADRNG